MQQMGLEDSVRAAKGQWGRIKVTLQVTSASESDISDWSSSRKKRWMDK